MYSQDNALPPHTSPMNIAIPMIIYGTAWKKDDTERLVSAAIRCGFRGIDTACQPKHYNESGVGAGFAACLSQDLRRADLYLQTKFTSISGQDPARIPYDASASLPEQVEQSLAVSLRNLRTDYLDCLLLHSPLKTDEQTLDVWRAFERAVHSGTVRRLGVSNCYDLTRLKTLFNAARIKPTVLQNRFYTDTGYDTEIRAFCLHNQIRYQSFWTLSANPQLLGHRNMTDLALHYGRTPAQILFRYLTQIGVTPLTGTRSEIHMREDLAIAEFELAAPDCHTLAALFPSPSRVDA